MARLTVTNNVTLDGVMQAPGRPDEDRRGGFEHGGWAQPYNDRVMGKVMGERMARGGSLLFGRRTYEDFAEVWPKMPQPNPFTKVLTDTPKYVASTTLEEPLPWENSTLLKGDVAAAVAKLKKDEEKDIVILGSGELIKTLMEADLIDAFVLSIHPIVLGEGRHLFTDGMSLARFRLTDSTPTTTGVIIATYERTDPGALPTA
jgi:dihydrofolate reductase